MEHARQDLVIDYKEKEMNISEMHFPRQLEADGSAEGIRGGVDGAYHKDLAWRRNRCAGH